ncbi:maleylpyruvate isomerase family mycothiol-dependent enzyme [Actinokineospora sp. UTMC 2448]|uniref:maleylpyruvate isomerase family mycothiol-dependent enzyme n=1 Tax=Actinokineospora sp. UTMC 2448 TaxID=2268449 RepID=UPI0021640613|nr:maleylpyruvate isomerase family mycothiol-dependent enzyme [Actinokineospora sp. UTMC 2448]UVS80087.1 putative Actinobacterial protein [Actinokineospora sp. UTMC 2448]
MDTAAAFVDRNRAFADVLAAADPDTPVPACPGWTLRQLLTHVGRGDRWAATIVATRAEARVDPKTVADGKPPADHTAAVDWLAAGPGLLIDAVAADPDVPVWTFVGPRPAAWWVRRRLHEVLVHRADALLALGSAVDEDPALAADGVAEWLSLLADGKAPALDDGVSLHLHATDTDGEWTLRRDGAGVVWEPGHAKATAAVRGPAMELLLVLLRRTPLDRVDVFGDQAVAADFLDRTPF